MGGVVPYVFGSVRRQGLQRGALLFEAAAAILAELGFAFRMTQVGIPSIRRGAVAETHRCFGTLIR